MVNIIEGCVIIDRRPAVKQQHQMQSGFLPDISSQTFSVRRIYMYHAVLHVIYILLNRVMNPLGYIMSLRKRELSVGRYLHIHIEHVAEEASL